MEPMPMVEVLKAAREYVERGWCQGTLAEFADNDVLEHEDDESGLLLEFERNGTQNICAVCMQGALVLATGDSLDVSGPVWKRLADVVGTDRLHAWNDTDGREKSEVLAAFDKAIELEVASCP